MLHLRACYNFKMLKGCVMLESTREDGKFGAPHSEMGFFNPPIPREHNLGGQSPPSMEASILGHFMISRSFPRLVRRVTINNVRIKNFQILRFLTKFCNLIQVSSLSLPSTQILEDNSQQGQWKSQLREEKD
ncbi:hypothetical protein L1987_03312 [Smallanthus sonchifolius]|uniref:Uncharacterized protein n=1 Tax=Smallanthus sonchifolius TaxID=185202 RepID=A0ACB9KAF5_9ASTR|nr:hypothetical protein L1987_03312 [Smallanthus sonchifolius]